MDAAQTRDEEYSPLRLVRVAAGMTQEELAKAGDVTQAWISSVECGRETLGGATAVRIADNAKIRAAMIREGVTVEDLIRGARS